MLGYCSGCKFCLGFLAFLLATPVVAQSWDSQLYDGSRIEVPGEDVVVGDLLTLVPGTYVGADSRIIKASHIKIDESALTGESIPVDKSSLPIRHTERSLANQSNMAFMGTLVVGGKGLAVVVATGIKAEYGKMIALTTETFPPQTPLIQQLQNSRANC